MTDQQPSVEQVDPATLLVDTNIRGDTALDKAFLASIRDLGVLVPIVAVRTETGALRVRYGHRRTLAAVEVGRASVPVIATGDDGADEAGRIVGQWHENEQRAGLSTGDKVAAVEQLSLPACPLGRSSSRPGPARPTWSRRWPPRIRAGQARRDPLRVPHPRPGRRGGRVRV